MVVPITLQLQSNIVCEPVGNDHDPNHVNDGQRFLSYSNAYTKNRLWSEKVGIAFLESQTSDVESKPKHNHASHFQGSVILLVVKTVRKSRNGAPHKNAQNRTLKRRAVIMFRFVFSFCFMF